MHETMSALSRAYVELDDARVALETARGRYGHHRASVRGEGKEPRLTEEEYVSDEIASLSHLAAEFVRTIREDRG